MDKYDEATTILFAALILCDHSTPVFVSEKEALYILNAMWNAGDVTQEFRFSAFHGEDAGKEMSRYEKRIFFESLQDVYSKEKRAKLMREAQKIFQSFVELTSFPEKLMENAGLPPNYERTLLYAMCHGCILRALGKRL